MEAPEKQFIVLSDKAYEVLSSMKEKYSLEETDEQYLENIKQHKDSKTIILLRLMKDFVMQKISTPQFLTGLQQGLQLSQDQTKIIAHDIVDNLIPFLEKITEDQEPQQKSVSTQTPEEEKKEAFRKAKEALMQKIGASMSEPKKPELPKPTDQQGEKEVEITSVEENAKKIAEVRQAPTPTTPQAPKTVDPYKEVVE